jgi:hypothetical protein
MMPKKKDEISQDEQSKRFRKAVKAMIDAGDLSPTEADERFERLVREIGKTPPN